MAYAKLWRVNPGIIAGKFMQTGTDTDSGSPTLKRTLASDSFRMFYLSMDRRAPRKGRGGLKFAAPHLTPITLRSPERAAIALLCHRGKRTRETLTCVGQGDANGAR